MYGDIAVGSSKNAKKCLLGPRTCLWPRSSDGIVYIPYTIDESFSKYHQSIIQRSMKEFDYLTCIKFVYRRYERNYIKIISQNGCWANVGYNRWAQFVSLDRTGCIRPGIIQHELLHTIGFNHEQSRSDRDNYVTIIHKNIMKGAEYNFVKMDTNNLGTTYDYSSVMHYGRNAFAKDQKSVTIVPKPNPNIYIGQRYGMSNLDALKVNKLYNCGDNIIIAVLYKIPARGKLTSTAVAERPESSTRQQERATVVFIQFTKFQVEEFINCYSDRVIIHDGDDALAPVLEGPTCGGENPAVISSRKSLYIQFYSAQSWQAYGFSANYQFGNIVFKL
ncbi:low choriolytic enzyme-like [Rhincodon typus]|uniref:low choriolytic enzyme-like n=1 Tax=Rhincodon typus TaxID=259920 RepID=UPI00202E39DD|nr:low choriolytic enzyme-like [Rhincodon typus]